MHVLVTGGAGFIGSHLAEWHFRRGDRVHVVDDLSTGRAENLAWAANDPRFRFDEADIRTWHGLEAACQWADRIYHMAAIVGVKKVLKDPVRVVDVNVHTTEFLLHAVEKARWMPEIVLASSSEVYAHSTSEEFSERDDIIMRGVSELRWTYAISKFADEFLASVYCRRLKQKIVIVRLFNTIGPRQVGTYGMVVPTFVGQAVVNDDITVYGDGTQKRSFCDVRDAVEILTRLAANPTAHGQVVNVGNAQEISMTELAKLVRARAGSSSKITYTPYVEAYGDGFEDIMRRRPALKRQEELSGYKPQYLLNRTIDDLIAIARQRAAELYRATVR
ncbi:MAG TPA: NAD-dependent epimerase/dehydratase family protein [Alphaproteobacteria bacterium]|jgi:UDP-glucose 4-epimerase